MPPVGFELTISADERPQTYALDRAATGTGHQCLNCSHVFVCFFFVLYLIPFVPSSPYLVCYNSELSNICSLQVVQFRTQNCRNHCGMRATDPTYIIM